MHTQKTSAECIHGVGGTSITAHFFIFFFLLLPQDNERKEEKSFFLLIFFFSSLFYESNPEIETKPISAEIKVLI